MKKLLSLLLGAGLLCTLIPVSSIQANNTDDAVVSSQQNEKEFNVSIEGLTPQNGIYYIDDSENLKIKLKLNFPEKVDVTQLEVYSESESSNGFNIHLPSHTIMSDEQFTNYGFIDGFREGSTVYDENFTINIRVLDKENSTQSLYSDTLSISINPGELFVSKNEFNLSTNQLAVNYIMGNPDLTDVKEEFVIGFKRKDGTILETGVEMESSDPMIATYGNTILNWNDERLLSGMEEWPYYKEFEEFYWQRAKASNSKYTSFTEYADLKAEFIESHGLEHGGIGIGGNSWLNGIIARNPGTAYITLSAGGQSVKIKVNVSNLSEQPVSDIPDNFTGEYYSDTNTSINVNLSQPSVVSKDIFNASKATEKNSTFNILNAKGNLDYSWAFEGNKVNRTDVDVNLSIAKNDKYVSDIKAKTKLNDLLVLNFAHNGELPAPAKVKVYVGDTFNNEEQLYLNYWDSNKKSSSEVANSLTVKNGYVEFTINNCYTYFLTKEKVTDKEDVVIDEPQDNNKPQTGTDKPVQDNTSKTDVPNTGVKDNLSLYLMLSITSLMLIGCLVLKKRLNRQSK